MKKILFLLFAFTVLSVNALSAQDFKYSLGIKPLNFTMIDLSKENDFLGYYFGLELERKIFKPGKLTVVLPVTFANLKTIFISDYHRTGYEILIIPGLRYYPKTFNKITGFSFGAHLLLGYHSSESSGWGNRFKTKSNFQGLLVNANYSLKLRGNTSIKFELGSGARLVNEHEFYSYLNSNSSGRTEGTTDKHFIGGILNASVGFHLRFMN